QISTSRSAQLTKAPMAQIVMTCQSPPACSGAAARPAETGGALGGAYEDGVVTAFVFDAEARRTGATYSPNSGFLNRLFKREWNPQGVRLLGFVHSHPRGCRRPSLGDERYATRILEAIPDMPHLLLPLVMSAGDGAPFEILPFVAYRDGHGGVRVERAELRVVEPTSAQTSAPAPAPFYRDRAPESEIETVPLFARVQNAYDLDLLAGSRVVFVGAGGARAFAGDLVRAGVHEIVVIDGDTVSASNVATQHVFLDEVGRPKVDCVADELRRINPNVRVRTVARMLDDEIDDDALEQIVGAPFAGYGVPKRVLLCGFTDNFHAQARLHRFALTTGRPYLSGQVYVEGRGIELTFTHPETTPACARCATRQRYESYERGYQNKVGSAGTPISATVQLNALKGVAGLRALAPRDGPPPLGRAARPDRQPEPRAHAARPRLRPDRRDRDVRRRARRRRAVRVRRDDLATAAA
ncbi:MAG: ThiF family adenylyltransferase, partial [Actinobacteria bacterium]|nr:ThiF family adenylyltransferase [Actinomycetota bacterium]